MSLTCHSERSEKSSAILLAIAQLDSSLRSECKQKRRPDRAPLKFLVAAAGLDGHIN